MIDNEEQETEQIPVKNVVDDYGQYHVENPFEMCSILKSLIPKPEVVTAYYDDTLENFILTSIVAVDAKKRTFILDVSSDEKRNAQFAKSKRVTCKTRCNNVRVDFSINNFKSVKYKGDKAFSCDLPQNILYLQRRNYYRMEIPLGDKLICQTTTNNDTNSMSLTLADISSGGIGVNELDTTKSFSLFGLYRNCEIDLGVMGVIKFDLELRNQRLLKLKDNTEVLRLGYRFTDLKTPDNAKIQRYIHNIDMRKKQSK